MIEFGHEFNLTRREVARSKIGAKVQETSRLGDMGLSTWGFKGTGLRLDDHAFDLDPSELESLSGHSGKHSLIHLILLTR